MHIFIKCFFYYKGNGWKEQGSIAGLRYSLGLKEAVNIITMLYAI